MRSTIKHIVPISLLALLMTAGGALAGQVPSLPQQVIPPAQQQLQQNQLRLRQPLEPQNQGQQQLQREQQNLMDQQQRRLQQVQPPVRLQP